MKEDFFKMLFFNTLDEVIAKESPKMSHQREWARLRKMVHGCATISFHGEKYIKVGSSLG